MHVASPVPQQQQNAAICTHDNSVYLQSQQPLSASPSCNDLSLTNPCATTDTIHDGGGDVPQRYSHLRKRTYQDAQLESSSFATTITGEPRAKHPRLDLPIHHTCGGGEHHETTLTLPDPAPSPPNNSTFDDTLQGHPCASECSATRQYLFIMENGKDDAQDSCGNNENSLVPPLNLIQSTLLPHHAHDNHATMQQPFSSTIDDTVPTNIPSDQSAGTTKQILCGCHACRATPCAATNPVSNNPPSLIFVSYNNLLENHNKNVWLVPGGKVDKQSGHGINEASLHLDPPYWGLRYSREFNIGDVLCFLFERNRKPPISATIARIETDASQVQTLIKTAQWVNSAGRGLIVDKIKVILFLENVTQESWNDSIGFCNGDLKKLCGRGNVRHMRTVLSAVFGTPGFLHFVNKFA